MKEFEELYTVEDIAKMTMLTSRTIRNYLKDGLLNGKKIGGQWRFTKQDVEKLFDNAKAAEDMNNERRQDIMDFINGVNTELDGEIQLCTIADYYSSDMQQVKVLSDRFCELISAKQSVNKLQFHYEYIDKEKKARYTFFGTPEFIKEAAVILEEENKKLSA